MEYFNITRYIQSDYMCYKFSPNYRKRIQSHEYVMAPGMTGFVYQLFFNMDRLSNITEEVYIISDPGSANLLDFTLAEMYHHKPDHITALQLSYRGVSLKLMERPYDTNCNRKFGRNLSATEAHFEDANRKHIRAFDIALPYVMLTNESSTARVMLGRDFLNISLRDNLSKLLKRNSSETSCFKRYHVTNIKRQPNAIGYCQLAICRNASLHICCRSRVIRFHRLYLFVHWNMARIVCIFFVEWIDIGDVVTRLQIKSDRSCLFKVF